MRSRLQSGSARQTRFLAGDIHAPEGPCTSDELASYPVLQLKRIQNHEEGHILRRRIECMLGGKVVLHTDFSGRLSAETVYRAQDVAFRKEGWDVPDAVAINHRAREKNKTLQTMIVASEHRPSHLFEKQEDKIDPLHRESINNMLPPKKRKKEMTHDDINKAVACHHDVEHYYSLHATSMFGKGVFLKCENHKIANPLNTFKNQKTCSI